MLIEAQKELLDTTVDVTVHDWLEGLDECLATGEIEQANICNDRAVALQTASLLMREGKNVTDEMYYEVMHSVGAAIADNLTHKMCPGMAEKFAGLFNALRFIYCKA